MPVNKEKKLCLYTGRQVVDRNRKPYKFQSLFIHQLYFWNWKYINQICTRKSTQWCKLYHCGSLKKLN